MLKVQLTGIGLRPSDIGFDFQSWRPGQLEIAEQMLNTDKRIITLSAPTGFGKSVAVQIPGRLSFQRQLILTRTKQLQTQYERDGIMALYGRDNYACMRMPKNTAAQGICRVGLPCKYFAEGCEYFDQKRFAIASQEVTLNYSYFFLEANGPGQFTNYDWIVCDEGHSVPEELSKTFTIRIYFPDCRPAGMKVPRDKTLPGLIHWAKQNLYRLRKRAWVPTVQEHTNLKIRAIEFERQMELLAMIDNPDSWVVDLVEQAAIIRPIWPESLAGINLWPHSKKFIFCSATMNPAYTLPMLGIDPSEAEKIEIDSTFPKEYRPIFLTGQLYLNHRSDENVYKHWVAQVDEILALYPNHKGLIHTGNYQLANLLVLNSRHPHRMIGHSAETRQITLERFKNMNTNKVLVSPALTEGVDLPYDQCRFQIIAKVPFPNMLDKVWQARFEQDKDRAGRIYTQATIDQVVQAAGRGMRAEDDYCETWIIDANIRRLLQYTADFPKFFREAVRLV